jgi:hypothetical protein
MTKVRMLLISMLALLAIGAVASASASAACTSLTGGVCQLVETELTATAKYVILLQAVDADLAVTGIGTVLCKDVSGKYTGDEEPTGPALILGLVLIFTECVLDEHPLCKITEPIETKTINAEIPAWTTAFAKAEFSPAEGTEFATVNISGCEQEAIIKVTGKQGARILEPTTLAEQHTVEALASESTLKDGAKATTFSVTLKAELESLKKWALKPNEI